MLNEQANDELWKQKNQVMNFVRNVDSLTPSYMNMDEKLTFEPYPNVIRSQTVDTVMKLSHDSAAINYRLLMFTYKKGDKRYKITIAKDISYLEGFQRKLFFYEIQGLLALILVFSLLNIMISKKLLKPLDSFCNELENFNLHKEYKFKKMQTSTKEFTILASSFETLIQKVQNDFDNLRLFTENASHEMQTPLTVIQNSIELMIQKEGYDQAQIRLINNIASNANLLNKIHNDLLLISKLEANYYEYNEDMNYAEVLKNVINNYSILSENKGIRIDIEHIEDCFQKSNSFVANLLFNNLVMNAIKYAHSNTVILIKLNQTLFSIENTADELSSEAAEKIFERFYKGNRNSEGTGLGLSMVKQICLNLHYTIQYFHANGNHQFQVIW